MDIIKKQNVDEAEKMYISNSLWGFDKYSPKVYAQIAYDDEGFCVKFTTFEENPKREKKHNFEYVNEDSCVEFFANFMPEKSDRYINFETNAGGIINFSFRKDRYDFIKLTEEDAENLNIKAEIFKDYWTVSYKIGFDFLKKYYGDFDIKLCKKIKGNLFKCGDKTHTEHYMSHFIPVCPEPDYHKPEYFGEFTVI